MEESNARINRPPEAEKALELKLSRKRIKVGEEKKAVLFEEKGSIQAGPIERGYLRWIRIAGTIKRRGGKSANSN